jgi:hypothetical protein
LPQRVGHAVVGDVEDVFHWLVFKYDGMNTVGSEWSGKSKFKLKFIAVHTTTLTSNGLQLVFMMRFNAFKIFFDILK